MSDFEKMYMFLKVFQSIIFAGFVIGTVKTVKKETEEYDPKRLIVFLPFTMAIFQVVVAPMAMFNGLSEYEIISEAIVAVIYIITTIVGFLILRKVKPEKK